MKILRLIGALASLGVAAALAIQLLLLARPVLWPTIRALGQEQTTFFVLQIAGFSLSGSRAAALLERIAGSHSMKLEWGQAPAHARPGTFVRRPNRPDCLRFPTGEGVQALRSRQR